MLTFEEKLNIIESFPELQRKDVSLGRINFHYEESILDKKIVVYHLHPNGNGFVYAEHFKGNDPVQPNGMVNIREFDAQALREIIQQSIDSLSEPEPIEETWINADKQILKVYYDFDVCNIYAGEQLDGTYATYNGAVDYLQQEGFKRQED
ncbi:hypothetical protein CWR48_14210 [Oceanobacillus arenosus]|uniref:Uncharacterized protein n=1 Tax=Oceanobacillus arenosus TaxID=1229153 RepID=A0A3D8PPA4_9BACI|nr:hypothetical protein [Oceanobacillus arenosus]RDW17347.1 hypothetical protein CWR48_14210 [Oceanobacillus arenosus]